MSLLSNLKKKRNVQLEEISKKMDESGKKSSKAKDSRFWNLTIDEGNGGAIIRFLPPVQEGDEMPWVHVQTYAFQGPTGKWYYNNSLRTLDKPDPVSEANYHSWNVIGTESAKKDCNTRKIRHKYISNILVIKDPKCPENEGKVFLFSYGVQIHKMLASLAKPETDELGDTKEPVFAWDYEEGANFRFKAFTEAGYLKYDKSTFDTSSPLCGGDEDKIEAVLGQCHKLSQFIAPDQFKTYDELKAEFNKAWGGDSAIESAVKEMEKQVDTDKVEKKTKATVTKKVDDATSDDDLSYFKELLNDD